MTRPRLVMHQGATEFERLLRRERQRRLPRRESVPPRVVWPPSWWRGFCVVVGLLGAAVAVRWLSR